MSQGQWNNQQQGQWNNNNQQNQYNPQQNQYNQGQQGQWNNNQQQNQYNQYNQQQGQYNKGQSNQWNNNQQQNQYNQQQNQWSNQPQNQGQWNNQPQNQQNQWNQNQYNQSPQNQWNNQPQNQQNQWNQRQPGFQGNQLPPNSKAHRPDYNVPNQFREIARGSGIDMNEYMTITTIAKNCYNNHLLPLSECIGREIRKALRGEWFVFVSKEGDFPKDFCLSLVEDNDYLTLAIGTSLIQVCRMKH